MGAWPCAVRIGAACGLYVQRATGGFLALEVGVAELDRRSVRGALGGAAPGVAKADEGRAIGQAFVGHDAFDGVQPMMIVARAGVGIAHADAGKLGADAGWTTDD